MGKTVIEKIIEHNTGKEVKPGDIVTVNVDRVMIHDIFIPFVAEKFREMGFGKLWDPDNVHQILRKSCDGICFSIVINMFIHYNRYGLD